MLLSDNQKMEWAVAARPLPGETETGDCHLVTRTASGWLLAVADGLGHGPEAAAASAIFTNVLNRHSDENPDDLIRLSHEALKNSRGVACTIVTIDTRQSLLSWVGVGNVEGVVYHLEGKQSTTEYVTMRGGIVGYRLPELQSSYLRLQDGDIIALATDGILGEFVSSISPVHPPEVLANYILDHYAKPIDDALVLIVRWQSSSRFGEE